MRILLHGSTLAAAAALAAGIALALPLRVTPDYRITIEVTATGQRSEGARGSEVWLSESGGDGIVHGAVLARGWGRSGAMLACGRDQPARIRWSGRVFPGYRLHFVRNAQSGIVRVRLDGQPVQLDLFANAEGAVTIDPLEHISAPRWRYGRARSRVVLAFLPIFAVTLAVLAIARRRLAASPAPAATRGRGELVLFALPSLVVYTITLLAMWPAQMSPDSIGQWFEITSGHFSDASPAIQTMLMWLVTRAWPSPAAVVAVHATALAFVTAAVLREAGRLGVPTTVRAIAACLFPLLPANFFMVTTIWKDVTYGIALGALFGLLLPLLRTRGAVARTRGWRLAFVATSALVMWSRHNGVLVALAVPVLCGIAYRREAARFCAATVAGLSLVFVFLKVVVFPWAGVIPLPPQYRAIVGIHVLAAHLVEGTPFAPEERTLLERVLPLDAWRASYRCQTVVPLFWHPEVSYTALAADAGALNRLAVQKSLERPAVLLAHQACVTSMLWRIVPFPDELIGYTPRGIADMPTTHTLGLVFAPRLPGLHAALERVAAWVAVPSRTWLFWRPATFLALTILVAVATALGRSDWRWLLMAVPSLLNSLSLVPVIGSPDFRYQYGVVVIGLLALPLLAARRLAPLEETRFTTVAPGVPLPAVTAPSTAYGASP